MRDFLAAATLTLALQSAGAGGLAVSGCCSPRRCRSWCSRR
ncbi:hypothetical protein V2I01_15810 [Micromonospora sp. BRA006-A]|nr:hypothetical protein [Micromonospora sp. BRA006-A]